MIINPRAPKFIKEITINTLNFDNPRQMFNKSAQNLFGFCNLIEDFFIVNNYSHLFGVVRTEKDFLIQKTKIQASFSKEHLDAFKKQYFLASRQTRYTAVQNMFKENTLTTQIASHMLCDLDINLIFEYYSQIIQILEQLPNFDT